MRPEVAGRHDDELSEGTVSLHADPNRVRTQRAASGQAVAAAPAHDVSLSADYLAGVDRRHTVAQLHHLTDELVSDDKRGVDGRLGPLVPGFDVEVGATDACAQDADQNLAWTGNRFGHILQP
jgi:hypothetical protein